jgi:hypothetical protein
MRCLAGWLRVSLLSSSTMAQLGEQGPSLSNALMDARAACADIPLGPEQNPLVIGVLGDSNSSAQIASSNWPMRLELRIGNPNIQVQNLSQAGSVAAPVHPLGPAQSRLTGPSQLRRVLVFGIDLLVIRLGKNDLKDGALVSVVLNDLISLHLTALLGGVHPEDIRICLVSPFKDPFPGWEQLNTKVLALNQGILDTFGDANVIDTFSFYAADPDLFLKPDGLHSSMASREPCAILAQAAVCGQLARRRRR